MLVWSGIKWSASASDPEGRNEAKNAVVWAIIGLTVIVTAGSVLNFVFGGFLEDRSRESCVYGAGGILPQATINDVICIFLSILYGVAAGIALIVIVLAGIKWSASGDDPSARKSAKGWVINAVFGIIIVVFAANIVNVMVIGSYPGVVTPFEFGLCAVGGAGEGTLSLGDVTYSKWSLSDRKLCAYVNNPSGVSVRVGLTTTSLSSQDSGCALGVADGYTGVDYNDIKTVSNSQQVCWDVSSESCCTEAHWAIIKIWSSCDSSGCHDCKDGKDRLFY